MASTINSAGAAVSPRFLQLSRRRNGSQASSAGSPGREPRLASEEARLLLCLAGGREADHAIDRLVDQGIDWPRLLELSIRERTQPFVGRRLRQLGADRIPAETLHALQPIERIAEFRQLYLQKRLTEALEVLTAANIPVLLLKGAALGWTTYGSFADRPMGDGDLLVKPGQAREAFDLLTRAGWVRRFDAEFDSLYDAMHHLPPLMDAAAPRLGVGLEIHTEVIPPTRNPFNFSAADLWENCLAVRGLPNGVFAPTPMNSMLHCCIHFVWSHMFLRSGWRTFHDLAALCSRGQIDWSELADRARVSRTATCCYWSLRLARATSLLPVPDAVLDRLRPRLPSPILNLIELHMLLQLIDAEQSCPSRRLHYLVWTAAVQPNSMHHGRSRPWDNDGDHWAMVEENRREQVPQPKHRFLPSARAWLKYLKSVA